MQALRRAERFTNPVHAAPLTVHSADENSWPAPKTIAMMGRPQQKMLVKKSVMASALNPNCCMSSNQFFTLIEEYHEDEGVADDDHKKTNPKKGSLSCHLYSMVLMTPYFPSRRVGVDRHAGAYAGFF